MNFEYVCMLFFPEGMLRSEGMTPEGALLDMERLCVHRKQYPYPENPEVKLTYRISDGTVYMNASHIPCGVVFRNRKL